MCQLSAGDGVQIVGLLMVMVAFGVHVYRAWFDWENYSEQIVRMRRQNPIWKRHPTEMLFIVLSGARFIAPIGIVAMCAAITELITYCQA